MYPVVPRQWEERTRGQISISEADCIACGICAKKMSGKRDYGRQKQEYLVNSENAVYSV